MLPTWLCGANERCLGTSHFSQGFSLKTARFLGWRWLWLAVLTLGGCGTYPAWLPSNGPSVEQVKAEPAADTGIKVVDVTGPLALEMASRPDSRSFANLWGNVAQPGFSLGAGDVVEVSVWEAPPASLFGSGLVDVRSGSTSRVVVLPEQMVSAEGDISVPFVGYVRVAGRSAAEVEADIVKRLQGKANQPQVLVRLLRNTTSIVTVVGEVGQSMRMPLTARGERVLDAVASAGGVRQPVGKITLQLTRGNTVTDMPLERVITDQRNNVMLLPGDVLTALHLPYSFTVLGAAGSNREVDFEAQGINLTQALARVGGLQDQRADARGVFVFRFEDASNLDTPLPSLRISPPGKVPVVYSINLKDPASFFAAQNFPVRNKDVLFVSTAPAAELQKFLNIVGSVIAPVNVLNNAVQ